MWINNHWYTESEIKSLLEVKDRRIAELESKVAELEDKHWSECRQIAHYYDDRYDCPMCYIENKTLQFAEVKPNFYCGAGKLTEDDET